MIYRLLFIATLAPAVALGFRRGGDYLFLSLILLTSFGLSFHSWGYINPVWGNAISDLFCAALILLFCKERIAVFIGILFAVAAQVSIIYGMALQPEIAYNRAYAHVLSIIGHMENLALLYGAADGGLRNWIDRALRALAGPLVNRGFRHSSSDRSMDGEG